MTQRIIKAPRRPPQQPIFPLSKCTYCNNKLRRTIYVMRCPRCGKRTKYCVECRRCKDCGSRSTVRTSSS